MTPARRRLAAIALTVAIGCFLALAGGSALARSAEVDRTRREVERLRRELRAAPHESAEELVARATEGVDALRARAAVVAGGGGDPTRRVSRVLAAGGGEAGLTIERLAEHPRSSIVTANAEGTAEATVRWLRAVDSLVGSGTAFVRELSLVALPGNAVRSELALVALPGAAVPGDGSAEAADAATVATAPEATRIAPVLRWPATPPDGPGAPAEPGDRPRPPVAGGARSGGPVYLGRIETDDEARYAVRVEPQGVVAVVRGGDTVFGWTLVGSDGGRLVFEKEGVRHEIDR